MQDLFRLQIETPVQLNQWLTENHNSDDSVLLVTFKKSSPEKYVSTEQVLDELVSFDWIDGRRWKHDTDPERTVQLISKRKTQHWAKSYKDRAARLIADERMHSAGFAGIERAKANGGWTFMDDVDALIAPDDLVIALKEHPPAITNFDAFPPSAKRDILRWVKLAKTDVTRQKRINETAIKAQMNQRASGTS